MNTKLYIGKDKPEGWEALADLNALHEAHYEDDTFENVSIIQTLQHSTSLESDMQEIYRTAKNGCSVEIRVPYASSDEAWDNPKIRQRFVAGSFVWYDRRKAGGVEQVDFENTAVVFALSKERYGTAAAKTNILAEIMSARNVVDELLAFLRVHKPIRPPSDLTPPKITYMTI